MLDFVILHSHILLGAVTVVSGIVGWIFRELRHLIITFAAAFLYFVRDFIDDVVRGPRESVVRGVHDNRVADEHDDSG
jgi:hypothetical protein